MKVTAELIKAFANTCYYLAGELTDLASKMDEPENLPAMVKPRHNLEVLYDSGEMSTRTLNVLKRGWMRHNLGEIEDLEQLSEVTARQVKNFKYCGAKCLIEIVKLMRKYDVKFKEDEA